MNVHLCVNKCHSHQIIAIFEVPDVNLFKIRTNKTNISCLKFIVLSDQQGNLYKRRDQKGNQTHGSVATIVIKVKIQMFAKKKKP